MWGQRSCFKCFQNGLEAGTLLVAMDTCFLLVTMDTCFLLVAMWTELKGLLGVFFSLQARVCVNEVVMV